MKSTDRLRNQVIALFVRRPILWLSLLLVGTVAMATQASRLEINFTLDSLFESDHPSVLEYERFVQDFGGGDDTLPPGATSMKMDGSTRVRCLQRLSGRVVAPSPGWCREKAAIGC